MNMIVPIEAEQATVRKRRWTTGQRGGAALGVLAIGAAGFALLHHPQSAAAAPPPPVVTVAQPLVRQVSEWDDYVGRFAASRAVEVRPRVSGQVTGVHFQDGEVVRAGQLLFTLDPRPFAAALAEARADAASARSAQALAQSDLARANRLVGDEAISAGEVDSLRAKVRASVAALAAAEARVRARALDVEFTQVRAPIAGRISDRRIDAGNLVAGGEGTAATLLTTINALDPIYFTFDASEALFLKAQRARAAGAPAVPVEIQLQDEAGYRWKGRLDFTDNGLDPRSGTIRGRAVVANPGRFLTAGAVRPDAAGQWRHDQRAAGTRRCGADRPGAQDAAGGRWPRPGLRQAGRARAADRRAARDPIGADHRRSRGDRRHPIGTAGRARHGSRRADRPCNGGRRGTGRIDTCCGRGDLRPLISLVRGLHPCACRASSSRGRSSPR